MKRFLKTTTILLISLGLSFQAVAQTNDFASYPDKPCKQYYHSYWTAVKKTVTAPAHWKKPEWIAFGGVVAGGATLYAFDSKIRNFFQAHQTPPLDKVAKYGLKPWGSGAYSFPFVAGFYFYGVAFHKPKMRRVAMAATQAVIIGGVSVEIVKNIFGRVRPYQSTPANPRLWMGPTRIPQFVSFPSGHTVVAFSIATVFASAYKDKPWVGIVSYALATGVGLSRIYNDDHWSSDVLIGAALGFAIGKTSYHLLENNQHLKMGIMDDGTVGMAYHF